MTAICRRSGIVFVAVVAGFVLARASAADVDEDFLDSGEASSRAVVMTSMTLKSSVIKLNFKTHLDSIVIKGGFSIISGTTFNQQPVVVKVGSLTKNFTVDAKGYQKTGDDSFKFHFKSKNGNVASQTATFTITLKKGTFAATLAGDGLTNTTVKPATTITIKHSVQFDGIQHNEDTQMSYLATMDKSGTAKRLKVQGN